MNQPLRSTLAAMLLRTARACAPLAGAAALGVASPAWAAELNVVRNLDVSQAGADTVVAIAGSKAPVFTVFRLDSPARLVVDLAASDLSAVQGTVGGKGAVKQVAASQFADGKASVGRIVIALADHAKYDVKADGQKVLVKVSEGGAEQAAAPAPAPAPQAKVADAAPVAPPAEVKVAEAKVDAPKLAEAAPAEGSDPHLVSQHTYAKQVANPASHVTGAHVSQKKGATRLEFATDGEVGTYQVTELRDPARLAIDLEGVKSSAKLHVKAQGPVQDVRAGKQADGLRLVVDAEALGANAYRVERTAHGLAVVFAPTAAAAVAEKPAEVQVAEAKSPAPEAASQSTGPSAHVKDVAFKGDEARGEVSITAAGAHSYEVSRPDAHTAVLTVHHAELPKSLERALDTSAFGSPVKMVSSFVAQDGSGDVQIVATLEEDVKDEVKATKNGLRWSFAGAQDAEMTLDGVRIDLGGARAAGLQAEGPAYAVSGAPRKARYTGRRVSFEFKDIDIHNLLRIIAEVAKKNIVVADNVSGKITIRLRNVPWDQALDVILKSKGLDKDESGNIIRVLPAKELADERAAEAKAREDRNNLEEPKLRMIPVNYATAQEMQDRVKDLLSKKGSVTVDTRTNTLIVKDVLASLNRVEGLVRTLDLQTPQVLIEARIVEANSTFAHDIGIQWGGQLGFAPAFGNPTGLVFPSTAVVTGASGTGTGVGVQAQPNFAVDLPAATGTGKGGGLGFIFGSAGGAATLNLRIAAAESTGSAKTISAPKVTTLDNKRASISQGIAIPFSQFSASGVNTAFIEAKLELNVTPHVTQDGSVELTIDATNNQPNAGFTGSNGQPSITKKEAHTQVLVKDGDTTVIGGIYTRATGQNEDIVPVLGKIPVLGYFFRHRFETDTRTELLIFVTPHIVNRAQTVAVAAPAGAPAPASNP